MWTGDTLHGPVIGGKKSYLFAFLDFTDRHLFGSASDLGFHVAYMFATAK
jgi:putative transposase